MALPTLAADGSFSGQVPWRALEVLTGHVLRRVAGDWARELLELLGWLARPEGPSGPEEGLSLERLVSEPVPAIRDWLEERVVRSELRRFARWVALLVTGPPVPGVPAGTLWGRGEPGDPFVLPLASSAPEALLSAAIALWAGEPPAGELDPLAFRPGELVAWFEGTDPAIPQPDGERLAALLARAAFDSPALADALDGREDLGAGLDALAARLAGGDGLVAASAAMLPGATVHDLGDVAHGQLPRGSTSARCSAFRRLPRPCSSPAHSGSRPGPAWTTITCSTSRRPGSPRKRSTSRSPRPRTDRGWRACRRARTRSPRRARMRTSGWPPGCGGPSTGRCAGRGRRSGRARSHGAAGHAALRRRRASGGHAPRHAGHAARRRRPRGARGPAGRGGAAAAGRAGAAGERRPPEHPVVVLGRGLLEPLRAAYDSPRSPAAELAPPPVLPTVPATVAVHCVRGNVAAASASRAVTGLLLRLLEAEYESSYERRDDGLGVGAGDLAAGLMLRVAPAAGPGAVRVRAELTASVAASGLARARQRGLRARIEIDRAGGWLAGGADRPAGGVLRHP